MTKKNFIDEHTVKQFLSIPEEDDNVETVSKGKERAAPKNISERSHKLRKKEEATTNESKQGVSNDTPMKKDYRYIETKSKKFQMLIQPSVFEKIRSIAERSGESINHYIHSILEQAINKDEGGA